MVDPSATAASPPANNDALTTNVASTRTAASATSFPIPALIDTAVTERLADDSVLLDDTIACSLSTRLTVLGPAWEYGPRAQPPPAQNADTVPRHAKAVANILSVAVVVLMVMICRVCHSRYTTDSTCQRSLPVALPQHVT